MENLIFTKLDEITQNVRQVLNIIKGEDMADLTKQLVKLSFDNKLIMRDEITGNIYSTLSAKENDNLCVNDAYNLFITHLADKIRVKSRKANKDGQWIDSLNKLSRVDMRVLFENLLYYCTYNSRKEYYDSIPAWDKEERISTFMLKYFKCTAPSSFFWLFMTSVIGKIKEPGKCYVPYFFDFVGNKGIGKTLFSKRLLGKYAKEVRMQGSRKDDLLVEIYGSNLVIPIDDENTWVSNDGKDKNKFTYDEFKSFVTTSVDTFSRKFAQPESHDRSFVLVRTSNSVKQVWSTDERRQIIFESPLKEKECYIWKDNLDDNFFLQMLAEAKEYYEKNGLYKLDKEDDVAVKKQNLAYYNSETIEFLELLNFIKDMRKPEYSKYKKEMNKKGIWCDWNSYANWILETNPKKTPMNNRMFWRTIEAIANISGYIEYNKHKRHSVIGELNARTLFRIKDVNEVKDEEFPDVNF